MTNELTDKDLGDIIQLVIEDQARVMIDNLLIQSGVSNDMLELKQLEMKLILIRSQLPGKIGVAEVVEHMSVEDAYQREELARMNRDADHGEKYEDGN